MTTNRNRAMPRGFGIGTLALVVSLIVGVPMAHAQTEADANADSEARRLIVIAEDLARERERAARALEQDQNALRDAEQTLRSQDLTPAMLELARVDLASKRARLSGLRTRLLARKDAARQLDDDLAELRGSPDSETGNAEEIAALEEEADALSTMIDTLEDMRSIARQRVSIAAQRLTLYQARFELPELDAQTRPATPASRAAQREIDAYLSRASRYREDVSQLADSPPSTLAQKRLLELRALDQEQRAELAQTKRKMDRANRILGTLDNFAEAASTPVRILREGQSDVRALRRELASVSELMTRNLADLADQRAIIEQQGQIVEGADSTLSARLAVMDALIADTQDAAAYVASSTERAAQSLSKFDEARDAAESRELFERRAMPQGRFAWNSLGRGLAALPGKVVGAVSSAFTQLGTRLSNADAGQWITLLGVIIGGVMIVVFGQRGARWAQERTVGAAAVTLREASFLLPAVTALGAVWLIASQLGLRAQDRALLTLLAAAWLVFAVVRRSAVALSDYFAQYTGPREHTRFVRLLRGALLAAGVVGIVVSLARIVALSPNVADAADRLSMLVLLVLVIPVLRLRQLVIRRTDADSRSVRRATALLPAVMFGIAALGLAGYVNLAWTLSAALALIGAVLIAYAAIRAVLQQGHTGLVRKIERGDAETAEFWTANIVGPLYRVAQIGIAIGAVAIIGWLLGWDSDTPVISSIPKLFNATLFHIGETPMRVSGIVFGVLIIWLVFKAGGWSREVSYRVASRRFDDVGVRNSLATFTQYAVVVFGLMVALRTIGLDLTALTVFAGALGVGIGFGLQTIVTNFISGILLLVERPLAVKDIVNVDKYEGEVTQIGIRSLTVKTWDAQEVIIPNSAVITKPFTNWTRSDDVMRTVIKVRVSYEDDLEKALGICRQIMAEHEAVIDAPAPAVRVWEFMDTGVLIWVQGHSRIRGAINRAELRSQLLFAIWKAFREAGIRIPYPRHEVELSEHAVRAASALPQHDGVAATPPEAT